MNRKRLLIILGAAVGFVIIILIIAITAALQPNQQQAPKTAEFVGNFTCLPKKNVQPGQPQTLECAMGLKTIDGKYYGLRDLTPQDQTIEFDTEVTVYGDLSQPGADEKYDITGTIKVYSVEINQ